MIDDTRKSKVDQFIVEQIDSVPHLEALLLVWNHRPKAWSVDEMAKSLYVRPDVAIKILDGLVQRGLLGADPGNPQLYIYNGVYEQTNRLLEDVDSTYRREVVRISSLIHSKASAAVRDFARAFRFTRDKE
jgi:hypothetical protein